MLIAILLIKSVVCFKDTERLQYTIQGSGDNEASISDHEETITPDKVDSYLTQLSSTVQLAPPCTSDDLEKKDCCEALSYAECTASECDGKCYRIVDCTGVGFGEVCNPDADKCVKETNCEVLGGKTGICNNHKKCLVDCQNVELGTGEECSPSNCEPGKKCKAANWKSGICNNHNKCLVDCQDVELGTGEECSPGTCELEKKCIGKGVDKIGICKEDNKCQNKCICNNDSPVFISKCPVGGTCALCDDGFTSNDNLCIELAGYTIIDEGKTFHDTYVTPGKKNECNSATSMWCIDECKTECGLDDNCVGFKISKEDGPNNCKVYKLRDNFTKFKCKDVGNKSLLIFIKESKNPDSLKTNHNCGI
jgi:hypothetical protein